MRSFTSSLLVLVACGDSVEPPLADAGRDSGPAVARDAGARTDAGGRPDAGGPRFDAGFDAALPDAGAPDDAGTDAGFPDPCTEPPCDSYFFVASFLDVARAAPATPEIVAGFNLDGLVSIGDDAASCFHEDFTSPPPDSESGVDNQLGPIIAAIGSGFDLSGGIAESIAAGDLLILFEVEGVDDAMDDAEVGLAIYYGLLPAGVLAPMTGADGRLTAGQTFDIDPRSFGPGGVRRIFVPGSIVAGRLRAGPVDILLDLGLGGASFPLNLEDAHLRANLAPAGSSFSTGVIGAGLDVEDSAAMFAAAVDLDVAIIRAALYGQSDLDANPDGSRCAGLSAGMVFEAVSAIKGDDGT
jgi:hypothetical protein